MSNALHYKLLRKTLHETLKSTQLRALKRMNFKFDPFHPNVLSIRNVLFCYNAQKLRLTNPACNMKTEVASDRSEPRIDLILNNGKKYRILTENLTTLEVVQQLDRICVEFDPKKDEPEET